MRFTQEHVAKHPSLTDFAPATKNLSRLEAEVTAIYSQMDIEPEEAKMTLEALRREALKCHNTGLELKNEYEMTLGLDFVAGDEADKVMEVASARQLVAEPYLKAYNLEIISNRILRAVRSGSNNTAVTATRKLHNEVVGCRKSLHVMFYSLPDLGMTFDQWYGMAEPMRKKLRKAGRPGMPLECRLMQVAADEKSLMSKIVKESDGKIDTLDKAIEGVSLSNRGRPAASPLNKLDRRLANLRKDLEALIASPDEPLPQREQGTPGRLPATRAEKIDKMLDRIKDVEALILAEESELQGVEKPRRELEKLRAAHRDLVGMESTVKGKELTHLLLSTLKNEEDQLEIVQKIYELDPNAKETPTHQVNPKATRDRINRLRMSGDLDEAELKVLDHIEESMRNTKVIRAR